MLNSFINRFSYYIRTLKDYLYICLNGCPKQYKINNT